VKVLAIVNQADDGPGLFADVAAVRGIELECWLPAEAPPPAGPHDGVLVLGGTMHVDQTDRHPWMRGVLAALETALAERTPTLGVCLGAQMLALVAGAEVGPSPEPENGWTEVLLRPEARGDRLLGAFEGDRLLAFQGHSYAFATPPGAVSLAYSPVCEQAFRLGETAWGIQFHPEASVAMLEGWIAEMDFPEETRAAVLAQTRSREEGSRATAATLFGGFLDAVAERARP
jgi:GMP synthase (glutamine-hydrolysing)